MPKLKQKTPVVPITVFAELFAVLAEMGDFMSFDRYVDRRFEIGDRLSRNLPDRPDNQAPITNVTACRLNWLMHELAVRTLPVFTWAHSYSECDVVELGWRIGGVTQALLTISDSETNMYTPNRAGQPARSRKFPALPELDRWT